MAKMNWERARQDDIARRSRAQDAADRARLLRASFSPAFLGRFERSNAFDAPVIDADRRHFPATVTGGCADGTLQVWTFHSRAEADAAGFTWVGR